ncbi:hypothetical protein Cgig2_014081 [Carnegiea gigantea]|uniref:Uncharacterized protein n=1 Tax=Carnegiea gigantea TaxID=171969 RepID=A0A9Q1KX58_9CARY|nr:hypothetical protein Cgig2_014081 [Carnegiea gigantea]
MVALASLPYPFVDFVSRNAQARHRKLIVQSSIRVPSLPSKLTKRKNYLRPKILKTVTKPYPIPPPIPEDLVTPIESVEPSVEVLTEPILEYSDSSIVEQSEELGSVDESDLGQFQVVQQVSEAQNVVNFSWFSGRMVVRFVASFVGLFVLQTVVAVWVMGSGDSDEEDRNLGIEGLHMDPGLGIKNVEVGVNGDALGNSTYLNVKESEIEAKIANIRKMAMEARELEKKNIENGDTDMGDVSDEDEDDDIETEASRLRSGIAKEVDGRMTKLRKSSPAPLLNVNFLNKAQDTVKEAKNKGLEDKDENNMLMFEIKRKYRSHLTAPRDKPKGFQSIKGSRDTKEKPKNVDDEQPIKTNGNQSDSNGSSPDEDSEMNGLDSSFPERVDYGSQMDKNKPGSRSSNSLQTLKKRSGSDSGTGNSNKGSTGSAPSQASKTLSGINSTTEKLNEGINEDATAERGVIQDNSRANPVDLEAKLKYSQIKLGDPKVSATSEMHTLPVPLSSDEFGSSLSMRKVVLMQKGRDGEGLEGFFTLRIDSNTKKQSCVPYIVAFEARNDARNFSYLLESVFEDLPDASIDVMPLSTKDLKRVAESLNKEVIVVKKGEVQLYAGQPLAEVKAALRSLVK